MSPQTKWLSILQYYAEVFGLDVMVLQQWFKILLQQNPPQMLALLMEPYAMIQVSIIATTA